MYQFVLSRARLPVVWRRGSNLDWSIVVLSSFLLPQQKVSDGGELFSRKKHQERTRPEIGMMCFSSVIHRWNVMLCWQWSCLIQGGNFWMEENVKCFGIDFCAKQQGWLLRDVRMRDSFSGENSSAEDPTVKTWRSNLLGWWLMKWNTWHNFSSPDLEKPFSSKGLSELRPITNSKGGNRTAFWLLRGCKNSHWSTRENVPEAADREPLRTFAECTVLFCKTSWRNKDILEPWHFWRQLSFLGSLKSKFRQVQLSEWKIQKEVANGYWISLK